MNNIFSRNTTFLIFGLLLIISVLIAISFIANNNREGSELDSISTFDKPSPAPFLTIPPDPLQIQTEADINYAEAQNKVLDQFPWYNSLPLQETNYFVLFDLQKRTFKAKLYPEQNTNTSVEDQVASFQQEITNRLGELNIDTNLYTIEWSVNPE